MNLREMLASVSAKMAAIIAAAEGAKRALTAEEQKQFDDLRAEASRLEKDIERADAAARLQAQMAAPQPPAVVRPSGATGGTPVIEQDPTRGFRNIADYLAAVRAASSGHIDRRFLAAATTYGGESVGPDGGYAVPPQFAEQIMQLVAGEQSLLDRLNVIPMSSNQLQLPVDENAPWGTTGIYAEWEGEAAASNQKKPALKKPTLQLWKCKALVPLTDELLSDAPAMENFTTQKLAAAITAKVNEGLVAGDGIGKPLGFLKAPGIVTQAKSGATLAAKDIMRMFSRVLPEAIGSAFWVVHSTALPEIASLTLGNFPMWANNLAESPWGTLLGRPVFVTEYASDYNTLGDIAIVAAAGYAAGIKSGGIVTSSSIHFYFDQDTTAFKAVIRVGGLPLLSAPVSRKNGSTTLGHIVQLEVRS